MGTNRALLSWNSRKKFWPARLPGRQYLVLNITPGVEDLAYKFATALGIGLLIGAERERRKGRAPRAATSCLDLDLRCNRSL